MLGTALQPKHSKYFCKTSLARLPGLPMKFCYEETFKAVASTIGEYVAMDTTTKNKYHMVYAHFCILLDASKEALESVELEVSLEVSSQAIEYENRLSLCPSCNMSGHDEGQCPAKKIKPKQMWKKKGPAPQQVSNQEPKIEQGQGDDSVTTNGDQAPKAKIPLSNSFAGLMNENHEDAPIG